MTKKKWTVEDDLREIREEDLKLDEEPLLSPKAKKIILIVAAVIMSLIIASIMYLQYPFFGMISGMIESRPMQGNTLNVGGITVEFQNGTREKVLQAYYDNPDVETSLCLEGTRQGNTYFINYAYQPTILSQSYTHVTHERCNEKTILMFHTHPYNRCVASEQDIRTLRQNQEINSEIGMIIMCHPNRFSLYT